MGSRGLREISPLALGSNPLGDFSHTLFIILQSETQRLYITRDMASDIAGDIMFEHPPHHFDRWMRRTAGAPRGLLRFFVLKLLIEKSLSGAEIVAEIEKETGGRWKPSSGSIYPLLAWLQDKGYTKELPREEGGLKRYKLTEKGESFFEEQVRFGERLRKKLEFLAPMLVVGFRFGVNSAKWRGIKEPARRFVTALLDLRAALQENLTERNAKEIVEILNEGAEKLEGIIEKIKKG